MMADISLAGTSIASSGSATLGVVALDSSGGAPLCVRVTATGNGAYVKFSNSPGVVATTNDLMVQSGESTTLAVNGLRYVSVLSVSGATKANIATLERGSWGSGSSLSAQVALLMASFAGPKAWYDPADRTTLQQDAAGTTPVAAAGDPIGRIMDKSGAANHATQATTTSRPLWQTTYAAFDGTDDSWATGSIDFTSTDKVTVVAGVRKLSDTTRAILAELSATSANPGTFSVGAPNSAGVGNYGWTSGGTTGQTINALTYNAPLSSVVVGAADISAPSMLVRVNGAAAGSNTLTQGTGAFGNYPFYIGRRGGATLPFNGNLFGLIVIGRLLTAPELSLCEQYMAQQAGISF